MDSKEYDIKGGPKDGRKVFRKLGTCSRTFFHILNREFGHPRELEERASDVLAGGIMQKGHQCGMLWGASLAIGAEAYRSNENKNHAINMAVKATQNVLASFLQREHTISCRKITRCDFSNKLSFANNLLTEIQGNEIVIGAGYRIKDLRIGTNFGGKKQILKSDLNFKLDLSRRDNKTIIRYLDIANNQTNAISKFLLHIIHRISSYLFC